MQFGTLFSVHNPSKKAHPEKRQPIQEGTNFGHAMFLRYLEPEKHQPIQEGTNFGHAMFLHYLEPEKHKTYPETARISATPCFFATLSQQNAKNQPKLMNFV